MTTPAAAAGAATATAATTPVSNGSNANSAQPPPPPPPQQLPPAEARRIAVAIHQQLNEGFLAKVRVVAENGSALPSLASHRSMELYIASLSDLASSAKRPSDGVAVATAEHAKRLMDLLKTTNDAVTRHQTCMKRLHAFVVRTNQYAGEEKDKLREMRTGFEKKEKELTKQRKNGGKTDGDVTAFYNNEVVTMSKMQEMRYRFFTDKHADWLDAYHDFARTTLGATLNVLGGGEEGESKRNGNQSLHPRQPSDDVPPSTRAAGQVEERRRSVAVSTDSTRAALAQLREVIDEATQVEKDDHDELDGRRNQQQQPQPQQRQQQLPPPSLSPASTTPPVLVMTPLQVDTSTSPVFDVYQQQYRPQPTAVQLQYQQQPNYEDVNAGAPNVPPRRGPGYVPAGAVPVMFFAAPAVPQQQQQQQQQPPQQQYLPQPQYEEAPRRQPVVLAPPSSQPAYKPMPAVPVLPVSPPPAPAPAPVVVVPRPLAPPQALPKPPEAPPRNLPDPETLPWSSPPALFGPSDYGRTLWVWTEHKALTDRQLSVSPGQSVILLKTGQRGWILVRLTDSSKTGWIPAPFVSATQPLPGDV